MTLRDIVKACEWKRRMIHDHPEPYQMVVTGLQVGNTKGNIVWEKYVGYVVQVRKKAGAFGSDMVFIRHPDGSLTTHENQSYCGLSPEIIEEIKKLYPDGMIEEDMEYDGPYSINGKHPRVGKIIEPENGYYT